MDPELETLDLGNDHETDIDPDDPDGELKAADEAKKEPPKPEDPEHDDKKKEDRIPVSRHKEILEKERATRAELEAKVAQYEKGQRVAVFNEDITAMEDAVVKLEGEYSRLLAEGEMEQATKKMREIRAAERQINEAKTDMKVTAAVSQATERARYNTVLERIESAYPVLNPDDADNFDARVMARVVKIHNANLYAGMPPAASLQDAVETVLGKPETKQQERAIEITPRVSKEDVAAERKKDAVTKALDAARRTPPSTNKVGLDSDKFGTLTPKDIAKMSQEDFAKLPEDVLSRMRGDEL